MQSQGYDAYSYGNNLLLKASEYIAKYNLGYDVPYDRKFYRCEAILVNGPWAQPSNISRGVSTTPGVFDVSSSMKLFHRANFRFQIIYYQYAVKRGAKAKYTTQMKKAIDKIGGESSGKFHLLH